METSKPYCVVVAAIATRILGAEGAAFGRHQDRIRRVSESRLKCALRQILVQSHFFLPVDDVDSWGLPWLDYGGPPGTSWGAPGQLQGCLSRRQHPARGRARFLPEIPARQWLKLKTRGFVPAFS